jgi:hypothetical protein
MSRSPTAGPQRGLVARSLAIEYARRGVPVNAGITWDGFRRSGLIPRHADRCGMAGHHCQENCHPRVMGIADINCLARLASDGSEAHSGSRRYVQGYPVIGLGGTASPKLTRWRQKLNSTWKILDIHRPGMQDEICVAGYMHDSLIITKAKVTANDVLARPLVPGFLFHNSTPAV